MMEENNAIFLAGGDALVYLAGPMHNKYSTTVVWGHRFSTYVCVCVCLYPFTVKASSVCKMSETYLRVRINDVVL